MKYSILQELGCRDVMKDMSMNIARNVFAVVLVATLVIPVSALASTTQTLTGAAHSQATSAGPSSSERMTIKQAGSYYLDWACWINAANWRYFDLASEGYSNSGSYAGLLEKKYREGASRNAKQMLTEVQAFESPPRAWPKNVVKYINLMIKGRQKEAVVLKKLSQATDEATVTKYINKRINPQVTRAAKSIRELLNLPPVGTERVSAGCADRGSKPAQN